MRSTQSGFNLIEMMFSLALIGTVGAFGLPRILDWVAKLQVEMAAGEVAGILHLARSYSAIHNVKVAVKLRTESDGSVTHALYRDGDSDGVRNADIERGIDPEIRPPRRLAHPDHRTRIGLPRGAVPPRDPGDSRRRLQHLDDPIRFGRSDLVTFNPRGTSSPGTIYLTDGKQHLAAVRVNNRSGKISILFYDPRAEVWR